MATKIVAMALFPELLFLVATIMKRGRLSKDAE